MSDTKPDAPAAEPAEATPPLPPATAIDIADTRLTQIEDRLVAAIDRMGLQVDELRRACGLRD